MDKLYYIYKITCLNNLKQYIGQSIQPTKRWYDHKRSAINNPVQVISKAMAKHGTDNFVFEIVAVCKTKADADIIEPELMQQYNTLVPNGYNVHPKAGGGANPGVAKGDNHWTRKPENAAKMKNAITAMNEVPTWNKGLPKEEQPRFNKQHSLETKQQMSATAVANDNGARVVEAGKNTRFVKGQKPIYTPPKGTVPWNKGLRFK
jgi:group I intron endonuclease